MNFQINMAIDIATKGAFLFRGNAAIYNKILRSIDLNAEIPPQKGKGQILDLLCMIFSLPKYKNEKDQISNLIKSIDVSKGPTIIKLINFISIFRPENILLINPIYTKFSLELESSPEAQVLLNNMLDSISGLKDILFNIIKIINPMQIVDLIKSNMYKKGGKSKRKKSIKRKKTIKRRKTVRKRYYYK
jgi:hypothetical protein